MEMNCHILSFQDRELSQLLLNEVKQNIQYASNLIKIAENFVSKLSSSFLHCIHEENNDFLKSILILLKP